MALSLFIDLAGNAKTIALVHEHEAQVAAIDDHTDEASVLAAIETLFNHSSLTYSDLTGIVCVTGPGGFMSVRTGVVLANTLANQLQIPLFGVHASEVYGKRASSLSVLWLHSTRKTQVFVRALQRHAESLVPRDKLRRSIDVASLGTSSLHLDTSARHLERSRESNENVLSLAQKRSSFDDAQDDVFAYHSPALLSLDEAQLWIDREKSEAATLWCGELIPEHRFLVSGISPAPLKHLGEVLPALVQTLTPVEGILEPWYGREG